MYILNGLIIFMLNFMAKDSLVLAIHKGINTNWEKQNKEIFYIYINNYIHSKFYFF